VALGIALLAAGAASLLGAVLSRAIGRAACWALQWRCIAASAWVLNPVSVVVLSLWLGYTEVAWWSAVPLAAGLTLLTVRLQLVSDEADWAQEGCPLSISLSVQWLCSRMVFILCPMCLLSSQVALFLPRGAMLPQGPEIGLFVCGGCVLISAKFCGMCACLAGSKLPQAFVVIILLSCDWISMLHLMQMINDEVKTTLLLAHLLAAGLIQLRTALLRMRLVPRWSRALAQRRARQMDAGGEVDAELGRQINAGPGHLESSDSDDDRGPGSLPDGFHETLICLLGVPLARSQHTHRQFLCGARRAVVRDESKESEAAAPADSGSRGSAAPPREQPGGGIGVSDASMDSEIGQSTGGLRVYRTYSQVNSEIGQSTGSAASSAPAAALEIAQDERVCTVCQEEIKSGETVRPMPKCSHVFHAACLEQWAKMQHEATRCPTCRRPALSRKATEGSTSISVLAASGTAPEGGEGGARSSGSRTRPARAAQPPGSRPPRSQPGRGRGRSRSHEAGRPRSGEVSTAALRCSLGISEELALAALRSAGGATTVAAHVLLEHRTLLVASFGGGQQEVAGSAAAPVPEAPPGVVEALVQANPDLADVEPALRRQLGGLYQGGQLRPRPWAELSAADQAEVFRVLLEDVVRRLEAVG